MSVFDADKMGGDSMRIGIAVIRIINGKDTIAAVVALCNVLEVLAEQHPSHRRGIANQLLRSAGGMDPDA